MKKPHRSREPIVWVPFILGGGFAALFAPALMFVTGLAPAAGLTDADTLARAASHFAGRLFLLVFISLSLIHAAHRLRFALVDLGLHQAKQAIIVLCYGGALVGIALAVWLTLTG